MSELRIALVAEGPTDFEVISAALRAVLPRPFVLTRLQPEATRPEMGTGWGGVLKWCHAAGQRHMGSLDSDPTLFGFDFLIIHLDADVAHKQYADCGPAVAQMVGPGGWRNIPCALPCPPASDSCAELEGVLTSWLGQATPGNKTVWCIPAQSTGTWLAAAILPAGHARLAGAECNLALESQLANLPKAQRIKKTNVDYRRHANVVTSQWPKVKQLCEQACAFEEAVLAKM